MDHAHSAEPPIDGYTALDAVCQDTDGGRRLLPEVLTVQASVGYTDQEALYRCLAAILSMTGNSTLITSLHADAEWLNTGRAGLTAIL